MPNFTIVTPSYNYKDYVRECIESVLKQEGVTYEHLVYDAESTDGTTEILREYEDRISLTVEKDGGMSEAINKGFRAAKGDWVMWLNSDDELLPEALKKVKEVADKSPEADVIYASWNFTDRNGKFLRRARLAPFHKMALVHTECYLGTTATFYRRKTTIAEGHLVNEDYGQVMDGEYMSRLAEAGKSFKMLNDVVANFRLHGGNLSQDIKDFSDASLSRKNNIPIAERIAVRRTYGYTLFKNPEHNLALDGLLYLFYKTARRVAYLSIRALSMLDRNGTFLKSYHYHK